ncbi:hypothetical protein TRFO_16519 [Tritrichomonas foetus]|uniref:Leucine Rich Repeat family protein n=1 Tax=Tritrichomonas foetus TaxID=1144522 RepID=A0A1J4KQW2_9EUKA|nr:hypothetical protein TRFO_16519 [Tritrichomonas foetus]|eukprot:OHT13320.1 hypothetical protein TRFO_16519 [Tritrichomonas foetus]
MDSLKFDYHLKDKEQKSVEKAVPMSQAKIHMALRANLEINKHVFHSGAVVLSEHYLVLLKRRMFGKGFRPIKYIHLLDVIIAATRNDITFYVETIKYNINIVTQVAIRLARNFMRNYLISLHNIPPPFRFSFKCHDFSQIPPFDPKMSPSQAFQFAYNAHCSHKKQPYIHEIVQYYHSLLINEIGVFDINQIPLTAVEDLYNQSVDIRTIVSSLEFDPFIYGIHVNNITRPDIYASIAPLLSANSSLRIFSITRCYATSGLGEMADFLTRNKKTNVNYFDISNNSFNDMNDLIPAFQNYPSKIFYLGLNNTNMKASDVKSLLQNFNSNPNLAEIKYLHLTNCPLTYDSADLLINYISNPKCHLRSLAVTGDGVNSLLISLTQTNYQFESLNVKNSKLNDKGVSSLLRYIQNAKNLQTLDISGTRITLSQIISIVTELGKNTRLRNISLILNDNELSGKDLKEVIDAFNTTNLSKWQCLELAKNQMRRYDVYQVCLLANNMLNITYLSLEGEIGDEAIEVLMQIRSLQKLRIRGCPDISPLLGALRSNMTLKQLNIKHNKFGDKGYKSLAKLLKHNIGIQEIKADYAEPSDIESIFSFLDAVSESENIIDMQFPVYDTSGILDQMGKKDKNIALSHLVDKQIAAQIKVQRNLVSFGFNSKLNLKRIPELDSLILTLGTELQSNLAKAKPHVHSGITKILDLPLPYQNHDEKFEDGGEIREGGSSLTTEIVENVDSMAALNTLQYNSLIIKRPNDRQIPGADDYFNDIKQSSFTFDDDDNDMDDENDSSLSPTQMDSHGLTNSGSVINTNGKRRRSRKNSGLKTSASYDHYLNIPPPTSFDIDEPPPLAPV